MATAELQEVAANLASAVRNLQAASDIMERTLDQYNVAGLSGELTGLAAGEVVSGNMDRERTLDALTLAASIIWYLRDREGTSAAVTVLETTPLDEDGLFASMKKIGLV